MKYLSYFSGTLTFGHSRDCDARIYWKITFTLGQVIIKVFNNDNDNKDKMIIIMIIIIIMILIMIKVNMIMIIRRVIIKIIIVFFKFFK